MGSRPEEHYLLILKERTSPVWITSLSPDASLSKKNYSTFPALVQTWQNNLRRWREGRKRRSFSMTVHWAAPWPKIDLQTRVKSDEIFYHNFSNFSGMKTNWIYVPPHLVMPPGPGPTSTTWQPAREPPDLATRSRSLGSIMKFWESRFWAWKRNFFYINNPNVVKCLILP